MRKLFSLIIVLLLMTVACQKNEVLNPEKDIAQVGKLSVDKQVFMNRFRMSKGFAEAKKFSRDDIVKFIDEYFVKNYLLVNKLLDQGIEEEKEMKEAMEQLKIRAMTGMNGPLYRQVIPANVEVSDQEIQELYDKSKYKVKIAYLRVSSKHLADSLYSALRRGANFGKIARKYSLDVQTFEHGGEVPNYIFPGSLDPKFEKAIFGLKKGQLSRPIYIAGWYNIVKILDKKPIEHRPLSEIKAQLKQRLLQYKLNQIRNNYIDSLFIKYEASFNKELYPLIKKAFVPIDRVGKLDVSAIPKEKLDEPLVTYKGGQFTLNSFVTIYNKSMASRRVPLRYDDEIENHIKTMVIGNLMYADGVARGLLNDEQFKSLYQRIRMQKLEREALKRLVNEQIKITDDELKTYYEQHKQEWNNQDFETVKRFVRNRLMGERAREYKDQLAAQLRSEYDVLYNEPLIKEVVDSLNAMKKAARVRKF
ncbi:peptidylprolyl isomerase [Calditrichota bacterium GD2]